ncbi:hypothetical protein KUTeg_003272 [Tegillarca granosa]|uniref:Uncharacterized protein n=1 Tax=Tegillarca granosa TaxID=220873 RepID=A0ABQ9FNB4_TEGGR|nr:hypothetical protein KUTeg_003272 [Tegillarca granosa]
MSYTSGIITASSSLIICILIHEDCTCVKHVQKQTAFLVLSPEQMVDIIIMPKKAVKEGKLEGSLTTRWFDMEQFVEVLGVLLLSVGSDRLVLVCIEDELKSTDR